MKTILIERLDRRAGSLPVQELITAELKRYGFEPISAEEPDFLKDDPYGVMFSAIRGSDRSMQKTNIVLKLRGARQR